MQNKNHNQRSKIHYAGSVSVIDSSPPPVNNDCSEPIMDLCPTSLSNSNKSNLEILLNGTKQKLYQKGTSLNNSTAKHRSKTTRKYKISFSYACTTDEDSSNVTPKILNLQRLDQVTTKSDHRFVTNKLKPVMTCIVQRLIQEYRRSKENPSKLKSGGNKPSTTDTYSLSTSSCENLAKIKCKKSLESGLINDYLTGEKHPFNEDGEEKDVVLASHTASSFQKAFDIKVGSSKLSSNATKCSLSSQSGSFGYSKRNRSNKRSFQRRNEFLQFIAKDTFLFKRTKTASDLNIDLEVLMKHVNVLKSWTTIIYKSDSINIENHAEIHLALNEYHNNYLLYDFHLSHFISYRRNIHLSEYCIVKQYLFDKIVKSICRKFISMVADTDSFGHYLQHSAHDSNYSNEKDNTETNENVNKIKDENDNEKLSDEEKKANEKRMNIFLSPEEIVVPEKKMRTRSKDETGKSCFIIKKINRFSKKLKKTKSGSENTDDEESSSSSFSPMIDCEICHGDPVICFEEECRKSIIEQYVELLEEAEGITVARTSNNSIDMDDLKKLLYKFMDDHNVYPSEQIKSDIIKKQSLATIKPTSEMEDPLDPGRSNMEPNEVPNSEIKKNFMIARISKEDTDLDNITFNDDIYDKISSEIAEDKMVKLTNEKVVSETHIDEKLESLTLENIPEITNFTELKMNEENLKNSADLTLPVESILQIDDAIIILDASSEKETEARVLLENDINAKNKKITTVDNRLPELIINNEPSFNKAFSHSSNVEPLNVSLKPQSVESDHALSFDKDVVLSNMKSKESRSSKRNSLLKVESQIKENVNLDDILTTGLGIDKNFQKGIEKKSFVQKDENDGLTDSLKVLAQPSSRLSTIKQESIHISHNNIPQHISGSFIKLNESIEVDQFPTNDIFVEIVDQQEKSQRRVSKDVSPTKSVTKVDKIIDQPPTQEKKPSNIFDSNKTPSSVSSSSSVVRISTYEDLPKEKREISESSAESSGSQDTSGDVKEKYTTETSNFIDLSNNVSLENEEKIINSLRRNLHKSKDDNQENITNPMLKVKNVSASSLGNSQKNKNEEFKPIILNQESGNISKLSTTINTTNDFSPKKLNRVDRNTQTDSALLNNLKQRNSTKFREIATQTEFIYNDGSLYVSLDEKFLQNKINNDQKSGGLIDGNAKINDYNIKGKDYSTNAPERNQEIDDLLNKLKMILLKSEEYLSMLQDMSNKKPNLDDPNKETVKISQNIFSLLKDICSKEELVYLSDEERYKVLDENIKRICKALNFNETMPLSNVFVDPNTSKKNETERMDDGKKYLEKSKNGKNHVDFVESSSSDNDSLFEKVVRCVMRKLLDNQKSRCVSQGTSTYIRNKNYDYSLNKPQENRYQGDIRFSRSSENINLMKESLPRQFRNKVADIDDFPDSRKHQSKISSSSNIDSLIAECLPEESKEEINRLRNNEEKINQINIYDEIACRMNNLLQQVKKSQREVASRHSIRLSNGKRPLSNLYGKNPVSATQALVQKIPRSYSASDLEISGKSPKRSVTRHTVASIQNISSTANQSRKIKSGFRNIRKELKDKASRLMLNSKTRQKMLCSSMDEDNFSNIDVKSKVSNKTVNKKKIFR